jgi:hypothetical protein
MGRRPLDGFCQASPRDLKTLNIVTTQHSTHPFFAPRFNTFAKVCTPNLSAIAESLRLLRCSEPYRRQPRTSDQF